MKVPEKILVVDDDPAARAYVEPVLADVGFVCVAVESGRDALAQIEVDREIAVVVSDLVMPGLDGVRLGRFIRERFPDRTWLQVLFITAHAELELTSRAGGFPSPSSARWTRRRRLPRGAASVRWRRAACCCVSKTLSTPDARSSRSPSPRRAPWRTSSRVPMDS